MEGVYYDPKHGHCVRVMQRDANGDMYIMGVYGDDEAPGRPGQTWRAKVTVKEHKFLRIDFSEKDFISHVRVYSALWCPTKRQIHWEDGNVWQKLYSHHDLVAAS